MKGKSRVPVEAGMVHDAEGLKDQLKALQEEFKILIEDGKQGVKVVYEAEKKAKQTR